LQYNRARYLDSFTGKFISEDPISFQGGDSNLYRYVFNSPTNFLDSSGSFAIPLVPVAVGGLFFIGAAAILYWQNQQNSVNPFIDKPEPLDPRPSAFPNPTQSEIDSPFPKPQPTSTFDPNANNRGKDFGDIGKICRNLGFPLNPPLFPPFSPVDVPEILSEKDLEGKNKKELDDIAKEIKGKTLQNARREAQADAGSGQSGRSGGHGAVDKGAGNALRQAAGRLSKNHPLRERLRTEAGRLLERGGGTDHPMR
jgi:uncharacterized protein RhaS with RHS repeats